MTREEADRVQEIIDHFADARDGLKESSKKYDEATGDPAVDRANKWRNRALEAGEPMMRMQIINLVEGIIPDWEAEKNAPKGLNLLVGGLMQLFSSEKLRAMPSYIAVVDNAEEARGELGDDEFHKRYCLAVPSDIVQAAWQQRSMRSLGEMMFKEGQKLSEK